MSSAAANRANKRDSEFAVIATFPNGQSLGTAGSLALLLR
jgi:hypothetical protein